MFKVGIPRQHACSKRGGRSLQHIAVPVLFNHESQILFQCGEEKDLYNQDTEKEHLFRDPCKIKFPLNLKFLDDMHC